MAPKETAIERAQRQTRQGAEKFLKIDRDNVIRLVRSYDHVVQVVKNHLLASQMWVAPTENLPDNHPYAGQHVKMGKAAKVCDEMASTRKHDFF